MSFRFDNPNSFVSLEEMHAAQAVIDRWKKQELNRGLSKELNYKTSIPKDKWGVHQTHCCYEHGCEYGDEDCPIVLGLINQDHPCEECNPI